MATHDHRIPNLGKIKDPAANCDSDDLSLCERHRQNGSHDCIDRFIVHLRFSATGLCRLFFRAAKTVARSGRPEYFDRRG